MSSSSSPNCCCAWRRATHHCPTWHPPGIHCSKILRLRTAELVPLRLLRFQSKHPLCHNRPPHILCWRDRGQCVQSSFRGGYGFRGGRCAQALESLAAREHRSSQQSAALNIRTKLIVPAVMRVALAIARRTSTPCASLAQSRRARHT
jgi:hypothetical protein